MADATDGKAHVLLFGADLSGTAHTALKIGATGLKVSLGDRIAGERNPESTDTSYLAVRLDSSVASADINVSLRTAVASAVFNVQQYTPTPTFLMTSTAAVTMGAVTRPNSINRLFQVIKTGTGDLNHLLQATLDPTASSSPADAVWVTLMTSTANETTATTAPWRFVRSNVLSVSGALTVQTIMCA